MKVHDLAAVAIARENKMMDFTGDQTWAFNHPCK
jgi:hypothetical protein